MIRTLLPGPGAGRRWIVQSTGRGTLRGTLRGTATLYLAPTAANPQQVAVVGLPTPYGNPTFYLSAAVAKQIIDGLNAQAAVNAAAGIGLFQAPLPNLASMADAELCPLMSQGCVTQAQAPDRVNGCFQYNMAHPETRGTGICTDPRWTASSHATNPVITPQTDLVITSQYYAGFGPGTTQTQTINPPAYTPYTPPAPPASSKPAYNPTPTTTTPKPPQTTTTTTTTTSPNTGSGATGATTPPATSNGDELLNGGFIDDLISRLPAGIQDTVRQLWTSAGRLPLWAWGALLAVLLGLLLEHRRRKNRR